MKCLLCVRIILGTRHIISAPNKQRVPNFLEAAFLWWGRDSETRRRVKHSMFRDGEGNSGAVEWGGCCFYWEIRVDPLRRGPVRQDPEVVREWAPQSPGRGHSWRQGPEVTVCLLGHQVNIWSSVECPMNPTFHRSAPIPHLPCAED